MTEATEMLREEQKERSSIARSAHSKNVRMPLVNKSDAKSGPITQYNLNKPMDWKTFRSMPLDLQGNYIDLCIERHGARAKDMAEMLGCGYRCFVNYLYNHELKCGRKFPRGQAARKQAEVWQNWLKTYGIEVKPAEPVVKPEKTKESSTIPPMAAAILRSTSLELVGTWDEVMAYLGRAVSMSGDKLHVSITIKKEEV